MPVNPVAHWLALTLAVLGWGAVLIVFSVRILPFVLGAGPSGSLGNAVLKIVAAACLVLLYVFSPFGQMIAFDIAYSLIAPDRFIDLSREFHAWITPAIGAVSIVVTILLVRGQPAVRPLLDVGKPNDPSNRKAS